MTAEIAILNKTAVALAADSAVTIQNQKGSKIYNSANKLFCLSKYNPVGIMLFGNADFMGVPWETIIKIYRKDLKDKTFSTLNEYANNFIDFIKNKDLKLIPEERQISYVRSHIYDFYNGVVKQEIIAAIKKQVKEKGQISTIEINNLVKQIIKQIRRSIYKRKIVSREQKRIFIKKFTIDIENIIVEVFEKISLEKRSKLDLKFLALSLFFQTEYFANNCSGIVIAGFGEDELFPSTETFNVECYVQGFLKYKKLSEKSARISIKNNASITPFAQSEMVYTFMEGIDIRLQKFSEAYLNEIFKKYPDELLKRVSFKDDEEKNKILIDIHADIKKMSDDYIHNTREFRRKNNINPIIDIVSILPKEELASMAEALVNLTSFKRKITLDAETVGGPIDVAIISKGDGFIWIKRKHYFKPELNPYFNQNYFREDSK